MKLTMACMKCNRAVEVGALCPTCATPEDEEFNRVEMESRVKQEYVRSMRKTTREEKISRPAVYEVPTESVQFMSISVDDYLKLSEELAVARVLIRELGDRLSRLEKTEQEPVAYLSNKRQRINIELKPQTFVEIPTVTDWEMPLYMKPPQRTWVGLTDKEIDAGLLRTNYAMQTAGAWRDGVEWAQSQLKEKNNG